MTSTRFILPLDADDYLQPNALQAMIEAYEAAGEGTYVYCDWIEQESGVVHLTEDYDPNRVLDHLSHPVTCLFEREAWGKACGFDESLEVLEDWDFIINLNSLGYCGQRVAMPLLHYRMHTGTQRERTSKKHVQAVRAKWAKYAEGGQQLMACKSCGSRSRTAVPVSQMQMQQNLVPDPTGAMVLMEYMGNYGIAPPPFRSQVDRRRQYSFTTDEGDRIKYVFAEDVGYLERLGFKQYDPGSASIGASEEPLLEAVGPPVHADVEAEPAFA